MPEIHGEANSHTYWIDKDRDMQGEIEIPEKRIPILDTEAAYLNSQLKYTPKRTHIVDTPHGKFDLSKFAGLYHCPTHTIFSLEGEITELYEGVEVIELYLVGDLKGEKPTRVKVSGFGLRTLFFDCDTEYRLIRPTDEFDISQIHPTSDYVISPKQAIAEFEQQYRGKETLMNIEVENDEVLSCKLSTSKGKIDIGDFDGILDTEREPFYYETTAVNNGENILIKSQPSAPGHVFKDTPDIFIMRLENKQFVPALWHEDKSRYLYEPLENLTHH